MGIRGKPQERMLLLVYTSDHQQAALPVGIVGWRKQQISAPQFRCCLACKKNVSEASNEKVEGRDNNVAEGRDNNVVTVAGYQATAARRSITQQQNRINEI